MQSDDQNPDIPNRVTTAILLLILGIAAFLRLRDLSRTSLWYDEAVSWSQSTGSLSDLLASVAADNYPPLHNIVLWLSMPLLGDSETALRLPSAILGSLAVWLLYLIGKEIAGRNVGLLAAALLTVSPFHIWYSTEARMYALLATTGLLVFLGVLKLMRNPSWLWGTVVAIGGALFLYSHIYAVFGYAGVGLVCGLNAIRDLQRGIRPRASNAFIASAAMGISVVLFLPWLIILAGRARAVADAGFWIAYPDLKFLESMTFGITGSISLFWVLTALAAAAVLFQIIKPDTKQDGSISTKSLLVCLGFTIAPLLLAYLYSVTVQPILFDRYLIAAWPGFLLLASIGANRLTGRYLSFALVPLAVYLSYSNLQFTLLEKIRPDWRLISSEFESNSRPGDQLYLFKGFAAPALSYYLRGPDAFTPAEDTSDLAQASDQQSWLLLVHSNPDEIRVALDAFDPRSREPVARVFGWGASALSLYSHDELSAQPSD
ncbi:MAG: glycosyltransferase family 39 protein [Roseibium sp.]